MPIPITDEIRKRLEREYDERDRREAVLRRQTDAGLDLLKEAAILAAQGDVGAADALRTVLRKRAAGDPDEAFVRIVRGTHQIVKRYRLQARAFTKNQPSGCDDEIPEGADDDEPPPDPATGRQPTGATRHQQRNGAGKFRRSMITHRGASLFR